MPEEVTIATRRMEIGKARREKTYGKLVAAAAEVIARLGQDKATIDDFIQAAGVARGTFYNYFPTREHIINALWTHVGRAPFLEIHESCRQIEDPALRLISETRLVIDRAGADKVWGWLVYSLSGNFEDVNEDLKAFPLPTLTEGVAKKRFLVRDLSAARDTVVNMVRGGLLAKLSQRSSPSYEFAICEMMLTCLGATNAATLVNRAFQHVETIEPLN
jgi:AcrR family transcriptional regulator